MSADIPFLPFDAATAERILADEPLTGAAISWAPGFRDGFDTASIDDTWDGVEQRHPRWFPNADTPGTEAFDAGMRWAALSLRRPVAKADRWPAPLPGKPTLLSRRNNRFRLECTGGATESMIVEGNVVEVLDAYAGWVQVTPSQLPRVLIAPNSTVLDRFFEAARNADRRKLGRLEGRLIAEWWSGSTGESVALADTLKTVAVAPTHEPWQERTLSGWLRAFGIEHDGVLDAATWAQVRNAITALGRAGQHETGGVLGVRTALAQHSWELLFRHYERESVKPDPFPISALNATRAARLFVVAEEMQAMRENFLSGSNRYMRRMHWSGDAFTGRVSLVDNDVFAITSPSHLPPRIKAGRNGNIYLGSKRWRVTVNAFSSSPEGLGLLVTPIGSPDAREPGRQGMSALRRAATSEMLVTVTSEIPSISEMDSMISSKERSIRSSRGWFTNKSMPANRPQRTVPLWVATAAAGAAAGRRAAG